MGWIYGRHHFLNEWLKFQHLSLRISIFRDVTLHSQVEVHTLFVDPVSQYQANVCPAFYRPNTTIMHDIIHPPTMMVEAVSSSET
jgi:hypothetical protein